MPYRRGNLVLLALAGLGLLATERVTIDVYPRTVMVGSSFRLTCRVPRDARNRLLEYGVEGYRPGSQRDIDGERARVTWEVAIAEVPCGVGPAYCAVLTDDGRWTRVERALTVAGCGDARARP